MPPSCLFRFSWVSPGCPEKKYAYIPPFCSLRGCRTRPSAVLVFPTSAGSLLLSSLSASCTPPPQIPMQGEALRHHLLCSQPDSESWSGSVWFSWVTSEVRALWASDRSPLQTGSHTKENLDRTKESRSTVTSGMVGSRRSYDALILRQALLMQGRNGSPQPLPYILLA